METNSNSVIVTGFRRIGLSYRSTITYEIAHNGRLHSGTIDGSFDFISYHLIKWYHGELIFDQMILGRIDKLYRDIENGQN
jgi:hypothetical protein